MRCLVVDDSPVFLGAAAALLESEGVAVVVATNSDEAVRLLDEADPDVVLIDVDLGNERGFDLVARLAGRTRRGGGTVPTILISTHGPEDFEDLVIASAARGFLSKSALSADAIRELMNQDGRRPPGAG